MTCAAWAAGRRASPCVYPRRMRRAGSPGCGRPTVHEVARPSSRPRRVAKRCFLWLCVCVSVYAAWSVAVRLRELFSFFCVLRALAFGALQAGGERPVRGGARILPAVTLTPPCGRSVPSARSNPLGPSSPRGGSALRFSSSFQNGSWCGQSFRVLVGRTQPRIFLQEKRAKSNFKKCLKLQKQRTKRTSHSVLFVICDISYIVYTLTKLLYT